MLKRAQDTKVKRGSDKGQGESLTEDKKIRNMEGFLLQRVRVYAGR